MIRLTRLNGRPVVVNAEVLEFVEATPDTMISLTSGQKLAVRESLDEVVDHVLEYQQVVCQGRPLRHLEVNPDRAREATRWRENDPTLSGASRDHED